MKAGLYARYSTDEQDKASIEDQLRVCRLHVQKLGGTVEREYTDEGISGSSFGNRPGVQQLLADAFSGVIDTIVVMDLLRFARSEGLPPLIQRLKFRDVQVIGVQDGFHSSARTARMQAGLAAIMGAEFIESVRLRVHSALEMRAIQQRPTGGKAYGFAKDQQPIEAEAAIVKEVFARYAGGETMKAIVCDLNARGVPSPGATWNRTIRRKDGRWLVSGLHALLHNELYIGRVIWNRREFRKDPDTGKRTCRERPKSQWIVHELPERALVDRDTWGRCQARLGAKGGGQKGPVRYLLSGLLVCGVCGSKMNIYGGKDRRYVCGTFHGGGHNACQNKISVPRRLAEELILAPVIHDLESPELIDSAVTIMRELDRQQNVTIATVPEVARIEDEIVNLRRLVREGVLTAQRAAPAIEAAERERDGLQASMKRRAMKDKALTTETLRQAYTEQVKLLRETLKGDQILEARESLRVLVGEIRLVPEDGHLVAHFRRGVLEHLGTGTGVATLVAGVGFVSTYPPVPLKKPT
jgi:site-specific DNA recombinase